MFLPFICLSLPDDSPFWTAKENEGFWPELGMGSRRTVLENPGLVLVNHGKTGTSEIVPGKTYYDDPNYSKLAFNTHFPWEDQDPRGGTSMEYAYRSLDPRDLRGDDINFYLTGKKLDNAKAKDSAFTINQSMVYNGTRGEVSYRQAIMRRPPNNGVGYIVDLAETQLPGGVLRVDRSRIAYEYELTLGHYGLPHRGGKRAKIERRDSGGRLVMTAAISGRRVALIAYEGWDDLDVLVHEGCNAEARESTVIYARKKRTEENPPMELLVTVLLHRTDDGEWSEEELDPVKSIRVMEVTPSFSALGAELTLRDGRTIMVDFADIDGKRMC